MGRRRKTIIKGDFEPLDLGLVDHVALKTKPYYVEQHDDHWPPYAEITSTRLINRQPRFLTRRAEKKPEFLSDKFPQHRWQKWCGQCGEWVNRLDFSPKADAFDKLHPYCKPCRARHAKVMYWAAKEAAALKAA